MYSSISICVGSKDIQCGTRYTVCAKLMFVKLSIPSGNAKHTGKRSTNLVPLVKSCTISMLPLCQRVTRQYESSANA